MSMKRVVVVGGSGFVGTAIAKILLDRHYSVSIVDMREPTIVHEHLSFIKANTSVSVPETSLEGAYAVINLAGQNIFGKWNKEFMRGIRESRVGSTDNLVTVLGTLLHKPKVLVSASAVGYYGDSGGQLLGEQDEHGSDFLARVCVSWEASARSAHTSGIRVVTLRTAHVLGRGGFLFKVEPIFRMFLGGWFGRGIAWFPWIHIDDLADMYVYAIEHESVDGPYNASAPELVTSRMFGRVLARVLNRPCWLPMPYFFLKILLGQFAQVLVMSQKVRSDKIAKEGFIWKYGRLKEALESIYK